MTKSMSITIFFFLWFTVSCQTSSIQDRQIARAAKTGRHFIITMHGFNGDKDNFGNLEQVLIPHLRKLRSETNYIFLEFSYPSGSDTDVFDFAYNHLSRFLNEKIKKPTENDSIVFIAHSQGGIVNTVWKAAAQYGLIKDPKYQHVLNDKIYAQITDQVITLGTPFWGSNQAKLALNLNLLNAGFNQELHGLVFNSELILWMRHLAVAMEGRIYDDPTQYTNLAGIMPDQRNKMFYDRELNRGGTGQAVADVANALFKEVFKRHSFSSEKINSRQPDRFESDLTVVVPSTRSSFYYADKKVTCDETAVQSEVFRHVSLFKPAQYILTEGFHSSVVSKRTRGIANVPLFCLDASKCSHPTYRYLLKIIANCADQVCNQDARARILDKMFEANKADTAYNEILSAGVDLQGFSLDLNIQVPAEYELPEKYYSDHPYTQTESIETDAEGEEIYVTRRKAKSVEHRNMREKKLALEIIELDIAHLDQELKDMVDVRIIRKREGMSALSCWGKVTNCVYANELRIHITGWIKPKSMEVMRKYQTDLIENYISGFVLPLTIQLPKTKKHSFKKTTLFSRVRPGYSTFAKINFLEASNCDSLRSQSLLQQ